MTSTQAIMLDPKKYREAFTKELRKQMSQVFLNKKNLTNFAKKAGIDIPNHKMDKPSLMMHIAEVITIKEMNKQFHLGGDACDSTFIDQVENMEMKDRKCTQQQFVEIGTVSSVVIPNNKKTNESVNRYKPNADQIKIHEKLFPPQLSRSMSKVEEKENEETTYDSLEASDFK
jgi:hypothetical protein